MKKLLTVITFCIFSLGAKSQILGADSAPGQTYGPHQYSGGEESSSSQTTGATPNILHMDKKQANENRQGYVIDIYTKAARGNENLMRVTDGCLSMLQTSNHVAYKDGWTESNLQYCIKMEMAKLEKRPEETPVFIGEIRGIILSPTFITNPDGTKTCITNCDSVTDTQVKNECEAPGKTVGEIAKCMAKLKKERDAARDTDLDVASTGALKKECEKSWDAYDIRQERIQDNFAVDVTDDQLKKLFLDKCVEAGPKVASKGSAETGSTTVDEKKVEEYIIELAKKPGFSNSCEKEDQGLGNGKKSRISPGLQCSCTELTIDYDSCVAFVNSNDQFSVQQVTTQAVAQGVVTDKANKTQAEMNTTGNVTVGLNGAADIAGTKAITAGANAAAHSANVARLEKITRKWPISGRFDEMCNANLSSEEGISSEEKCKAISNSSNFKKIFRNEAMYGRAYASMNESINSGKQSIMDAFAFDQERKTNEQFALEFDGATKAIDETNPYFCMMNPEMCPGETPEADLTTVAYQEGVNIGGGGLIREEYAANDLSGPDISADGSYAAIDTSDNFEGDAPEAVEAQFNMNKAAGAAAGGAGGGGRASSSSVQTPGSRKAKLKKGKTGITVGNVKTRGKRRKRRGSSFRKIANKGAGSKYKNPFDALFKKNKKSKKEVTRALAADGVAMKTKEGVSLFKRISKVHRRKLQKRQLQNLNY